MRPFVYTLVAGFFVGVAIRSTVEVPLAWVVGAVGASLFFGILSAFLHQSRVYVYAMLACAACAFGCVRTELAVPQHDPTLETAMQTPVVIEGIVAAEPDIREHQTLLTVALQTVDGASAHGRALVHTSRHTPVLYGDSVRARGTLTYPKAFTTDAGTTFDYPAFLRKDGILYELRFAEVTKTVEGEPGLRRTLFAGKHAFLRALADTIPEPESALAAGLLVGAKRSLGETISEEFRRVGVTHIVVLSGFNLTVVAVTILFLCQWLPRRGALVAGALGIVAFTLMAGAGAAAVRAAVMALLALAARALARGVDVLHLLVLASFLMVLINPLILVADPGFQLSVVATAGLIVLSPSLERRLTRIPTALGLRAIVAATIATQVVVFPLILTQTGSFSVVALFANLAILPFVPFAMLVGFLSGLGALIAVPLALPFSLLATWVLSYILSVAHVLSLIPFASVMLPPPPLPLVVLGYVVAVMVLVLRHYPAYAAGYRRASHT